MRYWAAGGEDSSLPITSWNGGIRRGGWTGRVEERKNRWWGSGKEGKRKEWKIWEKVEAVEGRSWERAEFKGKHWRRIF